MPPFEKSMILSSAPAWERFGSWLSPAFSGVIIVEAVKQVYAIPPGKRARRLVPRLRPALIAASRDRAALHAILTGPFAFDGGLLMKRPVL